MITDLDIYRSANVLVKRHGQDALLDKGDLGGVATWQRIMRATKELLSKERPPEATVQ